MSKHTGPLDNIRVASPCPADWNQMFGSDRKRFCGQCKLNVYNLSAMTRSEAEEFLLHSEGRICVRYFQRADGTILTKNCPVGWQAVKRRASNIAAAVFSLIVGSMTGILGFSFFRELSAPQTVNLTVPERSTKEVKPEKPDTDRYALGVMGNVATPVKVRGK